MTDAHPPHHETPPDGDVEHRLRQALTTVAEARPVAPRLDDLRARVEGGPAHEGAVADVRSSHRRAVGAVVAAAVLAAVVAGALVATRDEGETTIATAPADPTATGWYLPEGLGTDWELVDVMGIPWAQQLSARREASFAAPGDAGGRLDLYEYRRPKGSSDPVTSLEPVERGDGATSRTYGVLTEGDGAPNLVVAVRGDRVLSVQVRDVDAETVFQVVDGWWESDGERIEPVPGMVRTGDASAVDGRGRTGHTQVVVTVRRPGDGVQLSYALSPSGAILPPTGIDDEDRGAAKGLAEDERPRPIVDVPGAPSDAWEVGTDSLPDSTSLVARAPGADITISDDLAFAPPPPGATPGAPAPPAEQVVRRRARIELLAALRTVDPQVWADAVSQVDADADLAALTLADVPTSDIGPGTTTTVLAGSEDPPATSSTTTVPSTSAPTKPTVQGMDPEAHAVAEALVAFALDPNDETFERMGLSGRIVRRGSHGDAGIAGPMQAERLRDPAEWDLGEPYGSPLTLIAATDVAITTADAATFCGEPLPTIAGSHLAVIVPVDPAACSDDFAIVLSGSGSSVTDVLTIVP